MIYYLKSMGKGLQILVYTFVEWYAVIKNTRDGSNLEKCLC
jgi:hypothetical protein